MLRRKNSASLPTTLPNSPAGQTKKGLLSSFQNDANDGSGRAIKMDAPLVKSWKQSSKFTKYSYYFLAFFIVLMFMGYKFLRYWNGELLVSDPRALVDIVGLTLPLFISFHLVNLSST